ncbi:unnamed protein product [Cuscuta campestris]|uniref:Uncharacterized protein n=1 Tax=Cuscuta campestris TaxID=132261 RepID=A0A484KJV4_9ASTE|nr:unnamed protein product [Cuscuta campestris]
MSVDSGIPSMYPLKMTCLFPPIHYLSKDRRRGKRLFTPLSFQPLPSLACVSAAALGTSCSLPPLWLRLADLPLNHCHQILPPPPLEKN